MIGEAARKQINMLNARLEEKDKLVAHYMKQDALNMEHIDAVEGERDGYLEELEGRRIEHEGLMLRIANLEEKNDNQAKIINGQRKEVEQLTIGVVGLEVKNTELGGEVTNLGNERDELALRIREAGKSIDALTAERAGLENRLNDALHSWSVLKEAAAELEEANREKAARIADLILERDKLKLKQLKASADMQDDSMMVGKIVAAITEAGYEVTGWGDDDQLTALEDSASSARDHIDDVMARLDEIRTER